MFLLHLQQGCSIVGEFFNSASGVRCDIFGAILVFFNIKFVFELILELL